MSWKNDEARLPLVGWLFIISTRFLKIWCSQVFELTARGVPEVVRQFSLGVGHQEGNDESGELHVEMMADALDTKEVKG